MVFDRDDDMLCDDTIYYLYPLRSLGRPARLQMELWVTAEFSNFPRFPRSEDFRGDNTERQHQNIFNWSVVSTGV